MTRAKAEAALGVDIADLKYIVEALEDAAMNLNGIGSLESATVSFTVNTGPGGQTVLPVTATYSDQRWLVTF